MPLSCGSRRIAERHPAALALWRVLERRPPMRVISLACTLIMLSTGFALAGPGSGEPRTPGDPEAGRPGQVLDESKCEEVWNQTDREGDTLSMGKAAPFVVNFALLDTNDDGKLTEAEFKEGCKKGLIQESASAQQPAGKIEPKDPAMEQ